MSQKQLINLGIIDGDGIGPEVISAALKVGREALDRAGVDLNLKFYDLGARRYLKTGELLNKSTLDELKTHDAILLGAIGEPSRVKEGILERGLLLRLRFAFDHYINLRPVKIYSPGLSPLKNPGDIDAVVVREGTEGPYTGNGGTLRLGTDAEIATETSVNTAYGVRRTVQYAFEQASLRRKKLTLVHKTNVLVNAGSLWQRIVDEEALKHPSVSVDYLHIDAATIFFAKDPSRFDVIVTDNLFGDILTDLAAAITGGIGLAASGNINPTKQFPSMFEPVHGSAPDIAGQGIADPSAAILSLSLMLDSLGFGNIAANIEEAASSFIKNRGDYNFSTEEAAKEIIGLLK